MFLDNLSTSVLKLCDTRRLSYEAASERCDLSSRYFADIARGKTAPTILTLEKLCVGFDLTPNDLLIPSELWREMAFREPMPVTHKLASLQVAGRREKQLLFGFTAKSLLLHFLCHLPVRGIEPPHLRAQALPVLSPAEEAVGGVGAAHAEGGAGAYRPGRRFRRVLRGVRLVGAEMK